MTGSTDSAPRRRGQDSGERLGLFRIPAQPEALKELRAAVRQVLQPIAANEALVQQLVLAIDEAAQNVIRHAYGAAGASGPLELTVWREPAGWRFEMRDYAPPVDLTKIKPRALDDLRPGGLGTHFIRTVMDEVSYAVATDGPGTVLTMRKRLEQTQA